MANKISTHANVTEEVPQVEVIPRSKRRRFAVSYKLRILDEADACMHPGEIGALLRREGIYSSHLAQWRKLRERGVLHGSSKVAKELRTMDKENRRLRQELKQARSQLRKAEAIIDVQKKVCALLGIGDRTEDDRT